MVPFFRISSAEPKPVVGTLSLRSRIVCFYQLACQRSVNQRDGFLHPIKGDETAKAGALRCAEKHLVERFEPISQRFKPVAATAIDDSLQCFVIQRTIVGG